MNFIFNQLFNFFKWYDTLGIPTPADIGILLLGVSSLLATFHYLIRPAIYKGETLAEVIEVLFVANGNAGLLITYKVDGEFYEKKITTGTTTHWRGSIRPWYDLEDVFKIRYLLNHPNHIFVKKSKTLNLILLILGSLGSLFLLVGLFFPFPV